MTFEWDEKKNQSNLEKHHIAFEDAQKVFDDADRIKKNDKKHSTKSEKRFFCIGKIARGVVTVRYTHRNGNIRIFGAGFWEEGKILYEKQNNLH
jgi:uncharacterized DUF497 family protein